MRIKLKKFTSFHRTKFILMSLNPKIANQLPHNFFYYLYDVIIKLFTKSTALKYAIYVDSEFAGSIAIYKNDWEWELGYFILPQFRGKGLATETVNQICKKGSKELALKEIKARTNPSNKSSIKILKKNGFIQQKYKHKKDLIFVKKLNS